MSTSKKFETTKVFGKKGELVINVCDLAEWKARGYKTEKPDAKKEEQEKVK